MNKNFHKLSDLRESRNYSDIQQYNFIWGIASILIFAFCIHEVTSSSPSLHLAGNLWADIVFIYHCGRLKEKFGWAWMGPPEKCRSRFSVLCLHPTPSSSHQDLCQALESLNSSVAALSASAQKVANRGGSIQDVATVQQVYEGTLSQAKERQTVLESLLANWQRWAASLLKLQGWVSITSLKQEILGQLFSKCNNVPGRRTHRVTCLTEKTLIFMRSWPSPRRKRVYASHSMWCR